MSQLTKTCQIALAALATALSSVATAEDAKKPAEGKAAEKKVTFEDHVLPIFRAKCGTCHNASDRNGGLVLDDYATMMEGGASGDVVFGGDLESSYLWLLVTHDSEPVMPPNSPKLPENELAVIKAWIEQGILRDAGSKAKKSAPNPALAKVTVTMERPAGPPPMPVKYLGDPALVPSRANSVTGLAVNPWSKIAAIGGHEQITLVDLDLLVPLGTLAYPEGTPYRIGFSQNGQLLYVGGGRGGQSGSVALFNVASGERIATVGNEYDVATAAHLSPDLSLVAIGTPKKTLKVYSSSDGEMLYEKAKHTDWVTATAFSPDGVLLASGDRAGGIVVWEAETGREFHVLPGQKGSINAISWRADSNVFASAGDDDQVFLWEMNDGKEIKKFNGGVGDIADLEYTRDGKLLVTGRSNNARLFDAAGKLLAEFKGLSDDGMRVAYDHEGKRVLAGDWTGRVLVWSEADKTVVGELHTNEPGANAQLASVSQQLNAQSGARKSLADQLAALNAELAKRKKAMDDAKVALDKATKANAEVVKQAAERDQAVQQGQAAVTAADKAHKTAVSNVETAMKTHSGAVASLTQLTKTRDESKKAVAAAGDAAVKDAAAKTLAAAEEAVNKASQHRDAAKQSLDQANAAVKTTKQSLDAAAAELAKRTEMRRQLDEKLTAAAKQLAAWQETSKKATSAGNPSDAETKRKADLTTQIGEADKRIQPLVQRRDRLQKALALGQPAK